MKSTSFHSVGLDLFTKLQHIKYLQRAVLCSVRVFLGGNWCEILCILRVLRGARYNKQALHDMLQLKLRPP